MLNIKNYQAQIPQNLALTKILRNFGKTSIPLKKAMLYDGESRVFLGGGGWWSTPKVGVLTYYFAFFFRKLHQNKGTWTPKKGAYPLLRHGSTNILSFDTTIS